MNLKSELEKITFENLDKTIKVFEKTMGDISNGINSFQNGMDDMLHELESDFERSDKRRKTREQKDRDNLKKIWGNKK